MVHQPRGNIFPPISPRLVQSLQIAFLSYTCIPYFPIIRQLDICGPRMLSAVKFYSIRLCEETGRSARCFFGPPFMINLTLGAKKRRFQLQKSISILAKEINILTVVRQSIIIRCVPFLSTFRACRGYCLKIRILSTSVTFMSL